MTGAAEPTKNWMGKTCNSKSLTKPFYNLNTPNPSPSQILLFSSNISLIDKMKSVMRKTNIQYSFVVIFCPTFSHSFLMKTINICRWAESPVSVMTLICINTDPVRNQ